MGTMLLFHLNVSQESAWVCLYFFNISMGEMIFTHDLKLMMSTLTEVQEILDFCVRFDT